MSALVAWIAKIALGVFLEKLRAWFGAAAAAEKQKIDDHATAVNRAKDDEKKADALKPESSAGDVDAAIDDEISHF